MIGRKFEKLARELIQQDCLKPLVKFLIEIW